MPPPIGRPGRSFICIPAGNHAGEPPLSRGVGTQARFTTIDDESEALAIVESSGYGLLTSVFTRDLARGLRFAESARAGWVNINEGTNYWESHLPFGGRAGSQSGLGRVGGRFSIERLTELKTIVVNLA